MTNFYINFNCSSPLSYDDGKWITEIKAKITVYNENDKETLAGKARFHFVDVESALDAGIGAFSLFDEQASTFDIYSELYVNDSSEFNKDVIDTIGEELWTSNLFIVDRVEVLPKYRGHNLATSVIDEAIRVFAGNTQLCALKAFPLQHEGSFEDKGLNHDKWTAKLQLQKFCGDEVAATRKLTELYGTFDFKSLNANKSYMIKLVN